MKYSAFKIEEKDGKPVRTSGGIVYTRKYDERGNRVKETTFRAETANDETRFVPTEEITLEFTCWN